MLCSRVAECKGLCTNTMSIQASGMGTIHVNNIRAGIFKQSMGARNREGMGLLYRPAWLHRLAEFIPWNRFLGSINV
jgi:hypothetical protein